MPSFWRNEVALFLRTMTASAFSWALLNEETATADASWCIQFRAAKNFALRWMSSFSIARPARAVAFSPRPLNARASAWSRIKCTRVSGANTCASLRSHCSAHSRVSNAGRTRKRPREKTLTRGEIDTRLDFRLCTRRNSVAAPTRVAGAAHQIIHFWHPAGLFPAFW